MAEFREKLGRLIADRQIDLVISNVTDVNRMIGYALCVFRKRVPVIAVEHNSPTGIFERRGARGLGLFRRRLDYGFILNRMSRVVAVSHGVRQELISDYHVKADRVLTIHNPIDLSRIDRLQEESVPPMWPRSAARPIVIAAGRLEDQKAFDVLIAAFATVLNERDATLVILGEGSLRPRLESQVAKLGVQERVFLPGFTENPWAQFKRRICLCSRAVTKASETSWSRRCGAAPPWFRPIASPVQTRSSKMESAACCVKLTIRKPWQTRSLRCLATSRSGSGLSRTV